MRNFFRKEMNITELKIGETAIVSKCDNLRLMEHGFTVGTQVSVYNKVSQHITCINIRGTVLACRNYECQEIEVEKS
jgi:Fe2+ transport system protein FeoA